MSAEVRAELAPLGRLRVALNYGNFLLVSSRAPEQTGVAPDLARELARRAGTPVEFVGYPNAGLAADAARDNAWDVAFIGAEPERADAIAFTPAYVEIEASYLVSAASPIASLDDVDRPGVRVASPARAAYTLYLRRNLRLATLVETERTQNVLDLLARREVDVVAGLRPGLVEDARTLSGARVIDGRFTAVQQAIAVAKERKAAAVYLTAFVGEIKTSGLLRAIIDRHDARGLTIAR
jgi:polar amino acid transport system substrate-binding protein